MNTNDFLNKQLAALERLQDNKAGDIMPLPKEDFKLLQGLGNSISKMLHTISKLEKALECLVGKTNLNSSCMYCTEMGKLHTKNCPIVLGRLTLLSVEKKD